MDIQLSEKFMKNVRLLRHHSLHLYSGSVIKDKNILAHVYLAKIVHNIYIYKQVRLYNP